MLYPGCGIALPNANSTHAAMPTVSPEDAAIALGMGSQLGKADPIDDTKPEKS